MFFRKISLFFLFLTVTFLAKAQSPTQIDSVLTLQQCVNIAIQNNLTVKKSATQVERDRIYWNQARENLLPTLNGSAGYGISFGRGTNNTGVIVDAAQTNSANFSLGSGLLLSNGLSAINNIKQNSLLYQAGKMDFQQVKDVTTLNVIALYFAALNAEDQLSQAKLQFEGSRVSLERETVLNNAGNVAPAEYYNIKGSHSNDQINVYNAENAVLTAKINLLEAMNVAFKKDVKLERLQASSSPAPYTQSPDDIYSTALTSLALVKAADLRVKAAEKEVAVAKGKLFPTLTLNGNYQTSYANNSPGSFATQFRENKYYGPSLNLSIPILNYFQNHNNVKLAKLDLKDAQDNNSSTQIQLRQQIDQAHANMKNAFDRLEELSQQTVTYQSAYDAQKVKFDAGVITSDLFIIAKNNLDASNVNLINARYDYLIRTKILDYYQGKLSF
ncbi:MAG TPA: TolC family protein [Mucilaginibacter sp.]